MDDTVLVITLATHLTRLEFAAWLSIRATCTHLHRYFMTHIIPTIGHHIRARVSKYMPEGAWPSGVAITGGFLVGCLYGEEYVGDLDIICDGAGDTTLNTHLVPMGYTSGWWDAKNSGKGSYVVTRLTHLQSKSIDIIRTDEQPQTFASGFDFAICRVCYDGHSLFIADTTAIITRHSEFDDISLRNAVQFADYAFNNRSMLHMRQTTLARVTKYIERGFTFGRFPSNAEYQTYRKNNPRVS